MAATEWTRNVLWRQGHLIKPEDAIKCGLSATLINESSLIVVISHSCDIAARPESEPLVEVLVGRRIDKTSGTYTEGKNSRQLHIEFVSSPPCCGEFNARDKYAISKLILINCTPDSSINMDPDSFTGFRYWLSKRYLRSAFPNAFNDLMESKGLRSGIAKIMKHFTSITALLFDVSDSELTHYELQIIVLYRDGDNVQQEKSRADELCEKLSNLFHGLLYDETVGWQGIELTGCLAVSEHALSYYESRTLRPWDLVDYLSFKESPTGPLLINPT